MASEKERADYAQLKRKAAYWKKKGAAAQVAKKYPPKAVDIPLNVLKWLLGK